MMRRCEPHLFKVPLQLRQRQVLGAARGLNLIYVSLLLCYLHPGIELSALDVDVRVEDERRRTLDPLCLLWLVLVFELLRRSHA